MPSSASFDPLFLSLIIPASTSRGSATFGGVGAEISCLNAEPLGNRDVPGSDEVEAFELSPRESDELRGL